MFDSLHLTFEDGLFRGSIFEQIERTLGRSLDADERRYIDSTSLNTGFISFDGKLFSRHCEDRIIDRVACKQYIKEATISFRETEVTVWVSGAHNALSDDQIRDLILGVKKEIDIPLGSIGYKSYSANVLTSGVGLEKPMKSASVNIMRSSPAHKNCFEGNYSYEAMKKVDRTTKQEVESKGGRYV